MNEFTVFIWMNNQWQFVCFIYLMWEQEVYLCRRRRRRKLQSSVINPMNEWTEWCHICRWSLKVYLICCFRVWTSNHWVQLFACSASCWSLKSHLKQTDLIWWDWMCQDFFVFKLLVSLVLVWALWLFICIDASESVNTSFGKVLYKQGRGLKPLSLS